MELEREKVKYIAWKALEGLAVFIVIIAFFRNCTGCDNNIVHEPRNYDSLFAKLKADSIWKISQQKSYDSLEVQLVAAKRNTDSLVNIKNKVEQKYIASSKTVRDLLKNGICDSAKVIYALNDCDSLRIVDSTVIASKDTIIKQLEAQKENLLEDKAKNEETLTAAKNIISGQAQDYAELKKASKKALRKQKLITWLIVVVDALKDAALIVLLKG